MSPGRRTPTPPGCCLTRRTKYVSRKLIGFSSAWIAEHHFTRYGVGSSALVIAGYIAGRTQKIRLGTGVLIPTLHNPIRLAEDTATMDSISGGRLDVGFGRVVYGYEYSGFGVDPDTSQEHFQESVNIIEGLWTNSEFSHKGQFYDLNKVSLAPLPVQSPHPPIYIAATRTPETLDYCISRGHNLCIAVVMDTAPALDLLRRFVSKSAEVGTNKPASEVPFFRYMYVAETNEQAVKDTAAHLEWVLDMLFWRGWLSRTAAAKSTTTSRSGVEPEPKPPSPWTTFLRTAPS